METLGIGAADGSARYRPRRKRGGGRWVML